jgi:hypothetical protein
MLRAVTEVEFLQKGDGRNLGFSFDFVHEFEASDTWVDLTNQCKITFPKNVYVKNQQGQLISLGGTNPDVQVNSLFHRGDYVSISMGYYRYSDSGVETKEVATVFQGYISKVTSKKPIQLECEDNMWLLKQRPCKPTSLKKTDYIEDYIEQQLQGTGFTVNKKTKTTVGALIIGNETVAQLLARLRKDFHLEAYFRGDELRIGSQVYLESDNNGKTVWEFIFQQNIISDELEFKRLDDIILSAVCHSMNTKQGSTNKRGKTKTKQERLSVLVYMKGGKFQYIEKKEGVDFPANEEGERRTLFFPNVTSAKELADKGIDELKKYYYQGFRGKFTTFGIPYVRQGDNIIIRDRLMPDRDGKYKVRGVKYSGGIHGHRQEIILDYKLQTG